MPIYEYECTGCKKRFEAIQSFSDSPLRKCQACGGKLHKLVSECAFHLKGSGWYVTDYGGKKGRTKGKANDKAKDNAKTSAEDKGAAKNEAKPSDSSGKQSKS